MHTATRLGVRLARRVRQLQPRAHVCFYVLYASLNADNLLGELADSIVGGEFETPLVNLVNGGPGPNDQVFVGHQSFRVPDRYDLPSLHRYARLDDGKRRKLVGYVEASRGCAHRCLHCPITPVYGGRLRIVPLEVVMDDVRQLVSMGAEHITFGDPDFFNAIKHSVRILEMLHDAFPALTYDATIKIEHLLEHQRFLPMLKDTGCAFVVSAVESIDDRVLGFLRKGHTAADVERALQLMAEHDLVLRPTFVPFTPWTTLPSYLELLEFIEAHALINHIDPIQLAIRLLLPRGSSLLGSTCLDGLVGEFDAEALVYRWDHADPRVDALQQQVAAIVEHDARGSKLESVGTFYRIKDAVLRAFGRPPDVHRSGASISLVPHLTEAWFC